MKRKLSSTNSETGGMEGNDGRGDVDEHSQSSSAPALEQSAVSTAAGGVILDPHLARSLGMRPGEPLFRGMFYGTPQAPLASDLTTKLLDEQERLSILKSGEGTSSSTQHVGSWLVNLMESNQLVIQALLDSVEAPTPLPFTVVPTMAVGGADTMRGRGESSVQEAVTVGDVGSSTVYWQAPGAAERSTRGHDGEFMLAPDLARSLGMLPGQGLRRGMFYGTPTSDIVLEMIAQFSEIRQVLLRDQELERRAALITGGTSFDWEYTASLIETNGELIHALMASIESPLLTSAPALPTSAPALPTSTPALPTSALALTAIEYEENLLEESEEEKLKKQADKKAKSAQLRNERRRMSRAEKRKEEVLEREMRNKEEAMRLEEARAIGKADIEARAKVAREAKARAAREKRRLGRERQEILKAEATEEGRARLIKGWEEEERRLKEEKSREKEELRMKREKEIELLNQKEKERRLELEKIGLELERERAARVERLNAKALEERREREAREAVEVAMEQKKAEKARLEEEARTKERERARRLIQEESERALELERRELEIEREIAERIEGAVTRLLEEQKAKIALKEEILERERLKAKSKAEKKEMKKANIAAKRGAMSMVLEDRVEFLGQSTSEVLRRIQEDKEAKKRAKAERSARMKVLMEEGLAKIRRELAEEEETSTRIAELELELGRVRELEGSRDLEEGTGTVTREGLELELYGLRVQEQNLSSELDMVRAHAIVSDREMWESGMMSEATVEEMEAKKTKLKELSKEGARLRIRELELEIGLSKVRVRARRLVLELERLGIREQERY
ncbi:hypothetical protein [Candidatus Ichthyocystis sparus]|uniref:hypothetical protein n=1 Tax=Candidatus Ichthyocystis sparus TaxID=1561004 RepID=UPI000B81AF02|nr:hypothetical protein [Candidatus Ichthyocystis sparus]